ncbi:MAG: glycosyltransferase [Cytophagaceae bacterium]
MNLTGMQSEKRNKKILIICPHPENVAPGQRLKYEQYFSYFREKGIEIEVSPFMTMSFWNVVYKKGHYIQKFLWTVWGYLKRIYDAFRLRQYDGVYIFLWVTPFGPPIFEFIYSKILGDNFIYDIDDLVFLGNTSKVNKFISPLKGTGKMKYLMKKAKHVIVCTPKLFEIAKDLNPNVTDISSTIDTDKYIPVNKYRNDHPLILGWSGSHSTSKYLLLIEDVLYEISQLYNIKIKVIGDPNFRFKKINAIVIPWKDETEVKDLQEIDIGLYPLPNDPWVYGKSGLKALQYMGLGIPTIATAIGANFRVIEQGKSGFLANNAQDWNFYLVQLIENVDLRRSIGTSARERVEKIFSVNANKDKYHRIIDLLFR